MTASAAAPAPASAEPEPGTSRLEAFSDGVIAIAITLLVLEIGIPEGEGSLLSRLTGQWHAYLAYLISFVVVGIIWLRHHEVIHDLRRVDHGLLVANLLLLLTVSFVPFPTKVVGEELNAAALADQRTAAMLYGLTFLALALAFNGVWWWARRRGLLRAHVTPDAARTRSRRYALGPPAYLVTTLLALVSPLTSVIATGLVALSFLTPERRAARSGDTVEVTR